jgi:hypothetical protein
MLCRDPAFGREVIHSIGQVFREFRQQLLPRHARLLLQLIDSVRPKGVREFVRGKPPVLAYSHPGVGMVAIAVLPEPIEQTTQPTASGTTTPANQATEQTTQATAREHATETA